MDVPVWKKRLFALLLFVVILLGAWTLFNWNSVHSQEDNDPQRLSSRMSYQILRDKADSIGGNWLRTLNPMVKNVQGDLIWNKTLQNGVMRFINLPDPMKGFEYLLWIYDSRNEAGSPILGATLAEGAGKQELFVDFKPVAEVIQPYKFVLTMDKVGQRQPDDESIILMAQP